jgi:hypothetical protein
MYICIDFDGTIVSHEFPEIGEENPKAFFWMKRWQELGANLILFTMRSDNDSGQFLSDAVNYCRQKGIEFFGINRNPTQDSWTTSPKAYGHIYVDDAAFGCPLHKMASSYRPAVDWNVVGPAIEKILINKASYA